MRKRYLAWFLGLALALGWAQARTVFVDTTWSQLDLYPSFGLGAGLAAGVPEAIGPLSAGASFSFHVGSWQNAWFTGFVEYPFLKSEQGSALARLGLGAHYGGSRFYLHTRLSAGYEWRPAFAGSISFLTWARVYYTFGASRPYVYLSFGPRFYLDLK